MMTVLGEYALAAAMLTCMVVVLGAFAYPQTRNEGLLKGVRWGLGLVAGFLAVSSWGLVQALMDDNFKLAYVVHHSERTLAVQYKIAAFWAGQEGSLLFWALALAVMGCIMAWRGRGKNDAEQAVTLGVMAVVTGFFTCVMIFAGNPFELATAVSLNGEGLNPMLQNFAMVAHPPLLFLGYAGFTAPFAMLIGALVAGGGKSDWLGQARPWMVYAWIMLTVGIVLGAQWAYVELGWGGYWAWDPVENASILPWFTGTALLHSAILQGRRGIFKRWTAWLVAASFFLCVFGTYLTRSGVIQSVHAFEQSSIGTFFLVFLAAIGIASIVVIVMRNSLLRPAHEIEDLFSREGTFTLANVLLCIMTAVTLVGTIFPLISGQFGTAVTVNASFYNKVILPMALLLAAVMATGPIIGHGAGAGLRAGGKLAGMGVFGLLAAVAVFACGYRSPWAFAVTGVIGAVVAAVVIDVVTSFMNGNVLRALVARHRHWGAQLAHLGLAAIIAGVAGSSIYGTTEHVPLKLAKGAEAAVVGHVGPYTLALKKFDEVRRANHTAIVATVQVRETNGKMFELQPESRFYDQEEGRSSTEVAIRFSLVTDLYLTLDAWDAADQSVNVTTIINPLVSWIWIGGGLLALGGLVCLIPTRQGGQVSAAAEGSTCRPTQISVNGAIPQRTNSRKQPRTAHASGSRQ